MLGLVEELISAVERSVDWGEVCDRLLGNNGFSLDFYKPVYEETLLDAAMNKRGILGVMHLDEKQEILCSNIDDIASKGALKSANKLAKALGEKAPFMGEVSNIVLAGPKVETLSMFTDQDQALCLCSDNDVSLPVLRQQAGDLLQWSKENDYLA